MYWSELVVWSEWVGLVNIGYIHNTIAKNVIINNVQNI